MLSSFCYWNYWLNSKFKDMDSMEKGNKAKRRQSTQATNVTRKKRVRSYTPVHVTTFTYGEHSGS